MPARQDRHVLHAEGVIVRVVVKALGEALLERVGLGGAGPLGLSRGLDRLVLALHVRHVGFTGPLPPPSDCLWPLPHDGSSLELGVVLAHVRDAGQVLRVVQALLRLLLLVDLLADALVAEVCLT